MLGAQHTVNRQLRYNLYHAYRGTKEDTGLLPPHYTGVYTLGILNIPEDIRGRSLLSIWFRRDKHKGSPYLFVDLIKRLISSSF